MAEGARLEIVCVERHRGFESRSLRHSSFPPDAPRCFTFGAPPWAAVVGNSYGCGRRNVDEPRQAGNGATVVDRPGVRSHLFAN